MNTNTGSLYNLAGEFGPNAPTAQPIKSGTVGGSWGSDPATIIVKYANNPIVRMSDGVHDQQRRFLVGESVYNPATKKVNWSLDTVLEYTSEHVLEFSIGGKKWYLPELYYGTKVGGIYNGLSGNYQSWRYNHTVIPADGTYLIHALSTGSTTYNYVNVRYLRMGTLLRWDSYNGYQNQSYGYARLYDFEVLDRSLASTNARLIFDSGQSTHGWSYTQTGVYFLYPGNREADFPPGTVVKFPAKDGIAEYSIAVSTSQLTAIGNRLPWGEDKSNKLPAIDIDNFKNYKIVL
jgi:hypothetical protein